MKRKAPHFSGKVNQCEPQWQALPETSKTHTIPHRDDYITAWSMSRRRKIWSDATAAAAAAWTALHICPQKSSQPCCKSQRSAARRISDSSSNREEAPHSGWQHPLHLSFLWQHTENTLVLLFTSVGIGKVGDNLKYKEVQNVSLSCGKYVLEVHEKWNTTAQQGPWKNRFHHHTVT